MELKQIDSICTEVGVPEASLRAAAPRSVMGKTPSHIYVEKRHVLSEENTESGDPQN